MLHLPLIFSALVELLTVSLGVAIPLKYCLTMRQLKTRSEPSSVYNQLVVSAVSLVERISKSVPTEALPSVLHVPDLQLDQGYYAAASKLYDLRITSEGQAGGTDSLQTPAKEVFVDVFSNLCHISKICVENLSLDPQPAQNVWRVFSTTISIISELLSRLHSSPEIPEFIFNFGLDAWLDKISESLNLKVCYFYPSGWTITD